MGRALCIRGLQGWTTKVIVRVDADYYYIFKAGFARPAMAYLYR